MLNWKSAWRNIRKNKVTSALNVGGLAIGMAAFLLIINYVRYERSFDSFYEQSEEVFRINTLWVMGGAEERYATTPPPLAEVIAEKVPEVEAVCRVFYWSDFTMRPDDDFDRVFRETQVYAVDQDFFRVLDYGLLEGDPATVLAEPQSVVLPRSVAVRYFGEDAVATGNIVGRKLLGGKDAGTPWEVTGLMEDQPENSHLQFDFLISANSYPDDLYRNQVWSWNSMHTYVRTQPADQLNRAALQAKLQQIAMDYTLPAMPLTELTEEEQATVILDYPLQPLTDIHLHSNYLREMRPNGNAAYVNIFLIVAFLTIVMACINFVNLSTAQAARRSPSIGMRKILGARSSQLWQQYVVESLTTSFLAAGVAVMVTVGLQVLAGKLLEDASALTISFSPSFWLTIAGLALGTGILSGLYPAFYLARFRPLEALKGQRANGISDRGVRNGLVVFQFVLSIALIGGSLVVQSQVRFFQEKELGFAKEQLLVIENDREIDERKDAFKNELLQHPGIVQAGFANGLPGQSSYQMRNFRAEGKEVSTGLYWILADDSFLPTLELELALGENFRVNSSQDSAGIILNESAAQLLQLEEPVGAYIMQNEGRDDEERLQVVGVVKDFHLQSPHQEVQPMAFCFFKDFVFKDFIAVRLGDQDVGGAISHVEATWQAFEPDVPLQYSFLDESYNQLFRSEVQLGRVMGLFTFLAVLIACLGLFGLVSFTLEERVKEIGIRKVLGATSSQIVFLFTRRFLLLVLIAFALAAPLIWWGAQKWLADFAYRIDLGIGIFLLAGLGAILIAFITVGLRSAQAALANPVDSIRSE